MKTPSGMDRLIGSRTGLNLAIFLAHQTPPRLGHAIVGLVGRLIASRHNSALVRAIRTNQWVIAGGNISKVSLERATQAVLLNSAQSIYDVYHYIEDPASAAEMFTFDPSFATGLNRPEFAERGLVAAGLHVGNFDLALQWICSTRLIVPLVLTIPHPQRGRQLEFEIRQRTGMNLIPATMSGMRQAIHHLEQGGLVATGIDRPVPDGQIRPLFFGHPSSLPTHHIFLALKANVPVVIVACRLENDGKIHLSASPPIEMERIPNRAQEVCVNAEKVLAIAEPFIRQSPHQWSMSLPVWPEAMDMVPV